ncbi:hypothetical protein [Streptomyces sp. t39]|uniref:hypothetical protein n=1 Tax=Streptomyces sp. t39 TaxID=1828156 RepID=UPI0011CD86F3|nr:hypothetical protein [Streptomyces sp. t39]TXS35092.1 hypothetical protein EAO77_37995 [Streptomyces sp. t39]
MPDLMLKELRLKHAQLELRAEKLRISARYVPGTSHRALSLAREARETQEQADAYAALIKQAEAS